MKSLLKNLGLILMIIGAAILVGVFFTGSAAINDNGVLGGSAALIVIGLIVYIVENKNKKVRNKCSGLFYFIYFTQPYSTSGVISLYPFP